MGFSIINGIQYDAKSKGGHFIKKSSQFYNWMTLDKNAEIYRKDSLKVGP